MTKKTKNVSVFKYQLPLQGHAVLEMPAGADVVSVQNQHQAVTLWALVDPKAVEFVKRDFYVALTGEPLIVINAEPIYLDTVLLRDGDYVVHVFEVTR